MCQLCGDIAHDVALTERPAHTLAGRMWEGTFAEAAEGAIHALIAEVKAFSDARTTLWKSPIVGISWNDRPDGFRYLVGVAPDPGETLPGNFSTVELPEMRLASAWHGPEDGEVPGHYSRMLEWLQAAGLSWDRAHFHHREEYPPEVDLAAPPALRLLLPVAGDIGAPVGGLMRDG